MTNILIEHHVREDLTLLERAWSGAPTFAFLPEKSPVEPSWVARQLDQLPNDLKTHHFVLLTSGTTGQPKLILGNRARSEKLAGVLHEKQESEPVRQSIGLLPLTYTYAFVNQWLWSHRHGRELVITQGLGRPDQVRAAFDAAHDAMVCLVGIHVPLLESYFGNANFPGVIRVHFAGGRFPYERLGAVKSMFPNARIFNNYGCAEAMPRLTIHPAAKADEPGDIGRPLPGVELSANEAGELSFRSEYGALAVFEKDHWSRIGAGEWVKTGDLAEPAGHGTWRLKGRASDVFKRHGEKISLAILLSSVLKIWPGQADFYREIDPGGEEAHVLVLAPEPDEGQVRSILKEFRLHFSRAHWPVRIESVPRMPLLSNGKPDVRQVSAMSEKKVHWYQRV